MSTKDYDCYRNIMDKPKSTEISRIHPQIGMTNVIHQGDSSSPPPPRFSMETEMVPTSSSTIMHMKSNSSHGENLPRKQSSILGASFNLVNSIVGAGIIGIPYALRMSGLGAGIVLLVLVAIMTDKSLRLLIEQAYFHPKLHKLNVRTYEELASYPFGTMGSGFVLLGMFVMAYGAMVAYLLIIKDTIPTILGYEHGTHMLERNLILFSTSLVIVVPLSMQRDMASLSFSSAMSVVADIVLVLFIAAYSPVKETVEANGGLRQVFVKDGINSTLFIGLGILSTAMACQHSAFIVSNSLFHKTKMRWRWVTNQSIALSAILCLILGVSGYLGFLELTQGDVLNNFDHDSMQANAARLLLAFTMFLTYPMESFVARHVLVMLMHNGDLDAHPDNQDGSGGRFTVENEQRNEMEQLDERESNNCVTEVVVEGGGILCMNRRQTWTVAIYMSTIIPAVVFNDIGPVLSFTGAIGGSCISYIGPGLVFLGVNGEEFLTFMSGYLDRWRRDLRSTTNSTTASILSEEELYQNIISSSKPFWYYLGLFPLWTYIANEGATNMRSKIDTTHSFVARDKTDIEEILPGPSLTDFGICIFFILFGIVAMVAGVVSNIHVQMTN